MLRRCGSGRAQQAISARVDKDTFTFQTMVVVGYAHEDVGLMQLLFAQSRPYDLVRYALGYEMTDILSMRFALMM